jgi:hypothetical protein
MSSFTIDLAGEMPHTWLFTMKSLFTEVKSGKVIVKTDLEKAPTVCRPKNRPR